MTDDEEHDMAQGAGDNSPADKPRVDYVNARVRYFDGEFLATADFVAEQDYHVDRLARHQALLHAPGVLEGLEVTAASARSVQVAPGSALDAAGNQALLLEATTVELADGAPDGAYIVDILFQETKDRPQSGIGGQTRFVQKPEDAIGIGTSLRKGALALARVNVRDDAVIKPIDAGCLAIGTRAQKYAGVRLPGPDGSAGTIRVENLSTDPDQDPEYRVLVSASGGLAIDGGLHLANTAIDPGGHCQAGIGVQSNTTYFRTGGGFAFYQGGTHTDGEQDPGSGGACVLSVNGNSDVIVPNKIKIGAGEDIDSPANPLEVHGSSADGGRSLHLAVYDTGAVSIGGKTSNPSHPLEVWGNGETALLAVTDSAVQVNEKLDAADGLSVGGALSFGATARQSINLMTENSTGTTAYGIGTQSGTTYLRSGGGFGFYKGGTHSDKSQDPGGGESVLSINDDGDVIVPNNLTIGAGTSIDSSGNPLEIYDGSGDRLLSIQDDKIDAWRLLQANAGLSVDGADTGTRIDANGRVSIGKQYSNVDHLLEVWDPSNTTEDASPVLAVTETGVDINASLKIRDGLDVQNGPVKLFGEWECIVDSHQVGGEEEDATTEWTYEKGAPSDGFLVAQLTVKGDDKDARGWLELHTINDEAEIRLGRCSNHFRHNKNTIIEDNTVSAPIRKGDTWRVICTCTQHLVVVSVHWISLGTTTS